MGPAIDANIAGKIATIGRASRRTDLRTRGATIRKRGGAASEPIRTTRAAIGRAARAGRSRLGAATLLPAARAAATASRAIPGASIAINGAAFARKIGSAAYTTVLGTTAAKKTSKRTASGSGDGGCVADEISGGTTASIRTADRHRINGMEAAVRTSGARGVAGAGLGPAVSTLRSILSAGTEAPIYRAAPDRPT